MGDSSTVTTRCPIASRLLAMFRLKESGKMLPDITTRIVFTLRQARVWPALWPQPDVYIDLSGWLNVIRSRREIHSERREKARGRIAQTFSAGSLKGALLLD